MSDLINGREMLKRYQEDLCYGIACKECSMCTEDGGCRVEEWIDKFPSAEITEKEVLDYCRPRLLMLVAKEAFPSADRPQGVWVEVDDVSISCRCSVCGWEAHLYEDDVYGMPYCPNCGAEMVKNDE